MNSLTSPQEMEYILDLMQSLSSIQRMLCGCELQVQLYVDDMLNRYNSHASSA